MTDTDTAAWRAIGHCDEIISKNRRLARELQSPIFDALADRCEFVRSVLLQSRSAVALGEREEGRRAAGTEDK